MSGILRLESLTKGNTLKQGDKTPLKYRLFDADGEKLNIAGKSAIVRLMYPDFLRVGYESEPLTVSTDNTVTFSIDKIIQPVLYYLEITVDGKYIFPSRNDESKLNIDKSSQGSDVAIIEIIGKDVLVRDIKEMVDSEIKPVVDDMIISNQKVLENEQVVQEVNILSKQLEERQNQVEQFNNQVITEMTDKDVISAPEIIAARGGKPTLGDRLINMDSDILDIGETATSTELRTTISPDNFSGTDFEKVQSALDFAVDNDVGVVFQRVYDISNNTSLKIKAPTVNRKELRLFGIGGGIRKTGGGFIFESASGDRSGRQDLFINGLSFSGLSDGTYVINGDQVISVHANNVSFRRINFIKSIDYIQSIYLDNYSVVYGLGDFIAINGAFNINISGGLCDWLGSFLTQSSNEEFGRKDIYKLTMDKNMIEGIDGHVLKLGTVFMMNINGEYYEASDQYIEFNDDAYINNLKVSNTLVSAVGDKVFMRLRGTCLHVELDNVRGLGSGLAMIDTEALSSTSRNVFAHNVEKSGGGVMFNDSRGIIKRTSTILVSERDETTGVTTSQFGLFERLARNAQISAPAGYSEHLVTFPKKIRLDDMVSIQAAPTSGSEIRFAVASARAHGDNQIKVCIRNDSDGQLSLSLRLVVLKYPQSVTG